VVIVIVSIIVVISIAVIIMLCVGCFALTTGAAGKTGLIKTKLIGGGS